MGAEIKELGRRKNEIHVRKRDVAGRKEGKKR